MRSEPGKRNKFYFWSLSLMEIVLETKCLLEWLLIEIQMCVDKTMSENAQNKWSFLLRPEFYHKITKQVWSVTKLTQDSTLTMPMTDWSGLKNQRITLSTRQPGQGCFLGKCRKYFCWCFEGKCRKYFCWCSPLKSDITHQLIQQS